MIYLVIGKQNSGKSILAEKLAMETGDPVRIYLATMKVVDEAGRERVKKHRLLRKGKGFDTVELLYDITRAQDEIKEPLNTTVLLECVSNLVGNEIYDNPERNGKEIFLSDKEGSLGKKEQLASDIAGEIRKLSEYVHNLVIVTNEYDRDDEGYDPETRQYVEILSMVNERLKDFCDKSFDLLKDN